MSSEKSLNFTLFGENMLLNKILLLFYTRFSYTKVRMTRVKNSAVKEENKRTCKIATYKRSLEKEQKRRKIDKCQEGAGLGVTRKTGLIPPPIPAALLLFEVTSGLNFPS